MSEVVLIPNEFGITAMTLPGGVVWKWAYQRNRKIGRIARERCPQGKTGDLRESISAQFEPAPPEHVIMEVHADIHYAASVHQGARPHRIRPVNVPSLRFFWEREGRMFVGKRGQAVNHPGIVHGQPFLSEALFEVMADVVARGR